MVPTQVQPKCSTSWAIALDWYLSLGMVLRKVGNWNLLSRAEHVEE